MENPKKILILPETEFSYISGSGTFLYFGKGIFRTLTYLELVGYSEPWYTQNQRYIQNFVKHLQ